MKKLFLFCLFFVCVSVCAQELHRVVSLKTLNGGAVVLQRDEGEYKLRMRGSHNYFFVCLGVKSEAVKMLMYLSDLKLGREDYVILENEQETMVRKGPFGGHALYDVLHLEYCVITRSQAGQLAKIVENDKDDLPIEGE